MKIWAIAYQKFTETETIDLGEGFFFSRTSAQDRCDEYHNAQKLQYAEYRENIRMEYMYRSFESWHSHLGMKTYTPVAIEGVLPGTEEILATLRDLAELSEIDPEKAHAEADNVVVQALVKALGSSEIAEAFEGIWKWYA